MRIGVGLKVLVSQILIKLHFISFSSKFSFLDVEYCRILYSEFKTVDQIASLTVSDILYVLGNAIDRETAERIIQKASS